MSKDRSNPPLGPQYVPLEGTDNRIYYKKANETGVSFLTINQNESLEHYFQGRRQAKAEADETKRQQAREVVEQEVMDLFASLYGSIAATRRRLQRGSSLEPAELYDMVNVLVNHQQVLGFQFQQVRNRAEQLDNDLNANTTSDYLGSPDIIKSKNEIDDAIVACLLEIQTILTRMLGSAEKTHQFLSDKLILDKVRHERYQFYYYLPVVLMLAMWVTVLGLELSSSSSSSYWVTVLRVVRGPLLTLTFIYLISVNISGWAKVRIDYVKLFSIRYVRGITPKDAFRFAGTVTMLFGVLLVVVMFASVSGSVVPILITGVAMWLVLLLLMLNPFHIMQRGARFSFVKSFIRIMLTPLYTISFGDAWLADQVLSTVAVMLDFEYLICHLSVVIWDSDENVSICLSSSTGIRPLIVALPAVWRLVQCLRSFYDTSSPNHLLNAGKYLSSLPVIAFSTAYELAVSPAFTISLSGLFDLHTRGWIVVGWVLTAAVNVLYSFLWDVFCDWNMIQFAHGCVPHIRRQRLYQSKGFYYFMIPFDFILRVLSTLKLTFTIVRNVRHSETIFTLLIFGEFLRRFLWNYLRVEVESFKEAEKDDTPTPQQLYQL